MASNKPVVPKDEVLDFRLPPDGIYSRHVRDNGASSSGSNIRAFFIDMGFLPSLVDNVIEENGEDDVELLLNTLTTDSAEQRLIHDSSGSFTGSRSGTKGSNPPYFATICHNQAGQTSKPESSDSLDSLFDDKDASNEISSVVIPKEEADDYYDDTNKATLLLMNFTVDEVNFAIDKLGGDAPVNELVDFIIAAQIAENLDNETDETFCRNELKKEENDETLFVTMEKTLHLLEMGFSENEVSLAIEKFGSDCQVSELADSIVTGRIAGDYPRNDKCSTNSFWIGGLHTPQYHTTKVKAEELNSPGVSLSTNVNIEEISKRKRPKEEYTDTYTCGLLNPHFDDKHKGKRPKPEYADEMSSLYGTEWLEAIVNPKITPPSKVNLSKSFDKMVAKPPSPPSKFNPFRKLDKMAAKPPFFLYGNVLDVAHDSWEKVSKFLYGIEPEIVDTASFSALSRKEGYVHNLPCENRFHILPNPAMTIQEALPFSNKWWPSWDTRKHLNCINSETIGVSRLCDSLTKTITDSRGQLSSQQQRDILHHCIALNLIWVGQFRVAPVEPELLEVVLGYPVNHTRDAEISSMERLQMLKYCFQTDSLGYHLSVLKSMFSGGMIVLSIFSGLGGAEIALQRVGVRLKAVVSVESSGAKRKILREWWRGSGQSGELEQIDEIQKLTGKKIENLIKKYGGFDLVVCQNPCSRCLSSSKLCGIASFDFSIFYEFVRVLQGVRNAMERMK